MSVAALTRERLSSEMGSPQSSRFLEESQEFLDEPVTLSSVLISAMVSLIPLEMELLSSKLKEIKQKENVSLRYSG